MKHPSITLFPVYLWRKEQCDDSLLKDRYHDGSWIALSFNIFKPDIYLGNSPQEALGNLILGLTENNQGRFPAFQVTHNRPQQR